MSEDPNNTNIDPNTVRELERARADLKNVRAELKAALADADTIRGERDTLRTKFEAYQTETTEKLNASTAALEKAKADGEAALAEVKTAGDRAILAAQAEAIATRLGAHNPADVVKLVDLSEVKRGEDGQFVGLTEALDAAKESRGYLFGEPAKTAAETGTTSTPKPPRRGKPDPVDARTLDPKDYDANKAAFLAQNR
ncbi:phage scaffolding protein [Gluconobacter oxydans]|nr:phage scaffolding protein [Gluconobacter oxydans]